MKSIEDKKERTERKNRYSYGKKFNSTVMTKPTEDQIFSSSQELSQK